MEKRVDRHDLAIGTGCSGAASRYRKAEVHWRLLAGLVARGMRGSGFVVSDAHAGVRAARRIVLGAAPAFARAGLGSAASSTSPPTPFTTPDAGIEKRIGAEPRNVWTAATLAEAEAALDERVAACRDPASAPATWLENVVPDGFHLPEHRRRHPHTSNPSSAPSSTDPSAGPPRSASCQQPAAPAARIRRSRRDRRSADLRQQGCIKRSTTMPC